MNSLYEADFASVMAPAQSSQQRAAVKGELWQDSGTKGESTCTWLNADRSPAQLFLMAMHWQEGRLFLIACTSFRRTHKTPLSQSFVSNLWWPAFKAASGSPAQKMVEEQGYRAICSWMSSPGPGIPPSQTSRDLQDGRHGREETPRKQCSKNYYNNWHKSVYRDMLSHTKFATFSDRLNGCNVCANTRVHARTHAHKECTNKSENKGLL